MLLLLNNQEDSSSTLYLPSTYNNERPPAGAELDRSHPLARGMILYTIPGGTDRRNLVTRRPSFSMGDANWNGSERSGYSPGTIGSGFYFPWNDRFAEANNDLTFFVTAKIRTVYDFGKLFGFPYSRTTWTTPNTSLNFGRENNTTSLRFVFYSGGSNRVYISATNAVINNSGLRTFAITRKGAEIRFYVNGRLHGSPITNGYVGPIDYGEKADLTIFNRSSTNPDTTQTGHVDGDLFTVGFWNRALAPGEIQSLYECPYQVVRKPIQLYTTEAAAPQGTQLSGSHTAQSATGSGEAEAVHQLSGSHQAQVATGSGDAVTVQQLSGNHQSEPATGSGSAQTVHQVSGNTSAQEATGSGTAQGVSQFSGSHQSQSATGSGTTRTVNQLSGSPTSQSATGTGSINLDNSVSFSGSHQAQPATGSGTIQLGVKLGGSHQSQPATGSGEIEYPNQFSGGAQAQAATGAGSFTVVAVAAGSTQAQSATGSGSLQLANILSGSHQAQSAMGVGQIVVVETKQLSGSHTSQPATGGGFIGVTPATPLSRKFRVFPEFRTFSVAPENRSFSVKEGL